jgi:hypothetical protein
MRYAAIVLAAAVLCSCGNAAHTVDAYIASVRSGKVSGNEDTDTFAAEDAIRKSRKASIDNYGEHEGTTTGSGCYWVTLSMPDGKDVPLAVAVKKEDRVWRVAQVSLTRKCECARNTNPCRIL